MATDYSALLSKLQQSIDNAVKQQEYHRLLELDIAVRKCVSEAVAASRENPEQKILIADRIQDLMGTYRNVSLACSEKSLELKAEFSRLNQSKKGAQQYLSVAGKH